MKCPYTGEDTYDAGDGIVMCGSCSCWGWSKFQYCRRCGAPHSGPCLRDE